MNQTKAINFLTGGRRPVEKYLKLQTSGQTPELYRSDDLRRAFNGFYRVRFRGLEWRQKYYSLFEPASTHECIGSAPPTDTFLWAVEELHQQTGNIEASFASKLVATLNGEAPVIDSIVVKTLGLRLAPSQGTDRTIHLRSLYEHLYGRLLDISQSPDGRTWIDRFDTEFSHLEGWPLISANKKIDFLMWGGGRD